MSPTATVQRIVHCDWGAKNSKRVMCTADVLNGAWFIGTLSEAGETRTLLQRIRNGLDPRDRVVIGFDFPIGYPQAFGEKAGLGSFVDAVPIFGEGKWEHFFSKTNDANLVSIYRPFYPRTGKPKGSTSEKLHLSALGMQRRDWFRRCELSTSNRDPASPLFWTLGPKAVGTAALCGWQEILQPLLADTNRSFQVWPFEGDLNSILEQGHDVVVETYPAEAYNHIGFPDYWKGKTKQEKRRKRAGDILGWAEKNHVSISEPIRRQIEDGFGAEAKGEDPFDALIGICSMIAVVKGVRPEGPEGFRTIEGIANHEGWIFGQQSMPDSQK